jgi:Ca2+-binding RTX toxin-like protein
VLDDGNVAANGALTIDGSSLGPNQTIVVDGYAEQDGALLLSGGAGNDVLRGGQGQDILRGLGGSDNLRGSGGADQFYYFTVGESTPEAADSITDFETGDQINLIFIDADTNTEGDQGFTWIGANPFSFVAGELRADDLGLVWRVEGDTDGDGAPDLFIYVVPQSNLSAGDFAL